MADSLHQSNRLIYLAGFMGSGKSTIGPILANTLGFDFTDIDALIEEKAGLSVSRIFTERGESAFRELERGALLEVSGTTDRVVALGGGTIANEENFNLIHANGVVVYLQLPPDEVVRRLRHKTDRPLLRDEDGNTLDEDVLRQRVEHLLERRKQFYERADVIIPTEQQRVGITVDEIVKKLRKLMTL